MAIILFDHPTPRTSLLPFTFSRPVSEIRIGILTITEKWEKTINDEISWLTENYLQKKYPLKYADVYTYVNGALIPDELLAQTIADLELEKSLVAGDTILAIKTNKKLDHSFFYEKSDQFKAQAYENNFLMIDKPWKIYQYNGDQIRADLKFFEHLKGNTINDPYTKIYNPDNVYVEEGARVRAAILNAENGPIYLGRKTEIKEGAMIRGPFALCEKSIVNMGAKLIGDNTIGPFCKVGGEVSNTVIFGYSNKSHDGFLGNSVIGEWCNIGADTNTSNLKNNYQKVKLWDYATERFESTGLQFCGLMMGDHAKCGINTMFNTGTVIGVGANVFGEGFPRNFIPSFAWGGTKGYSTFKFDKFLKMTETVFQRRNRELNQTEIKILEEIYRLSAKHRFWE